MTKAKLIGALVALAIIGSGLAFLPRSQGKYTEASTSKIEAISLTNYGLEVIGPQHPNFSKLRAENKSEPVTPFSVFVANNSNKPLATCSLKWEILLSDGQTITQFQTRTGTLETVADDSGVHLTGGIPAKGNLLFSLTSSSNNQPGGGTGFNMGGGSASITNQLSNSVKVRVSIDGALFTDGTYVGPDSNNYFEMFRGQIDATRELNSEIDQLVKSGVASEGITKHLKKVANTPSRAVQSSPGADSQYSAGKWFQKTRYARLLLLMQERKGDQVMLERIHTGLAKPSMTLQKLKEN